MFPKIDYQITMKCIQPGCEETFSKTKDCITHFRAEHNKDLQCPHCGKKVKYGAGLIHHVRIHTAERPYFCPVSGCTFRSATKNNLKVHLSGKLHGWEVLMQYAHIFDRPKKKRHYTDLPDIVLKRQKIQMKGMQPMMGQMGMGMPSMMGMPMMVPGDKMPVGVPPSVGQAVLPPQIPNVQLPKDLVGLQSSVKPDTLVPSAAEIAKATMNPASLHSMLATGSPLAPKDDKTAIVSTSAMKIENQSV